MVPAVRSDFSFAAARRILRAVAAEGPGLARFELLMCVAAGMSGGLVGVLWSTLVSAPWLESLRGPSSPPLAIERTSGLVAHAVALALGGGTLGFLFWLGWGLPAFDAGTPWHLVGFAYGGLLWAATALPALLLLGLRLPALRRLCVVLLVEALVAAASVGLFCAFAWHRVA